LICAKFAVENGHTNRFLAVFSVSQIFAKQKAVEWPAVFFELFKIFFCYESFSQQIAEEKVIYYILRTEINRCVLKLGYFTNNIINLNIEAGH
jgi:hypothetical protein